MILNIALSMQSAGGGSVLSGLVLIGFFALLGISVILILALTAGRKS